MYTKGGIYVGKHAGFTVEKPETNPKFAKPSYRRGTKGKRVALIRDVIREISGYAPYERRIIKLLSIGDEGADKRAMKFAKRRIGGHRRGKAKREAFRLIVAAQKKAAKEKAAKEAKEAREARERAEKEKKEGK
eukprot:CAMPEP_0197001368 /NCGR_PEP_ID=MMETSP1380-20130617/6079_1 /TAXON_ID=5936 /ORGANISM="Euplotes crassus, Strain CT5" /LENGTH=133 /DNA_ID=CAMNT_0042419009 /DNA_START=37 /DNA_END=438 /DNA_ORIENTATION=+